MPVDDAVHRGDVPPPIDLAGHMRELGRALLPAIVIAALIGAAVFFVRSELTEKQYAASVVTEIKPAQTLIPGDAFIEQMRAPFIELATDTDVLNQVLAQVDTDLDAAQLQSSIETAPGTSPALLTFTVTTSSPELAMELARTTVTTVAQASAANAARDSAGQVDEAQATIAAAEARVDALAPDDPARTTAAGELSELRSQLTQLQSAGGDQLVVLSSPAQSAEPVAPKPLSEALVAALAGLIVAAELVVLFRGRLGSRPSRSWARRASRKHGARFDYSLGGALPPILASKIETLEREGAAPSTGARHAARKRDGMVVVLVGEKAVFAPPPARRSGARGFDEGQRRTAVIELGLSDEWWRIAEIGDIESVVVLVSKAGRDKKAASEALRRIDEFDIPAYLVLQDKVGARRGTTSTPTRIPEAERNAS